MGKDVRTFSNIPFADTSSTFPLVLNDEEIGVKALVDFDTDIKQYVLDLNGEPYEAHYFLDPSFNPESKEVKSLYAIVSMNDKDILGETYNEEDGNPMPQGIEW